MRKLFAIFILISGWFGFAQPARASHLGITCTEDGEKCTYTVQHPVGEGEFFVTVQCNESMTAILLCEELRTLDGH